MSEISEEHAVDLRHFLAILKARKWTAILVCALVLSSTLIFSYWQTPVFSSTARLVLQPLSGEATLSALDSAVDVATESQLVASEPVAEAVVEEVDLDTTPTALLKQLDVSAVRDTRVVNITYSSPQPELARDVANAFARSYIEYKRQEALADASAIQQSLQQEIQKTSESLEQLEEQIRAAGNNELVSQPLENERNILLAQLGVLQQQLNEASSEQTLLGGGEVIESAQLPLRPTSPNYYKNGLLALLLGALLGIAFAFLRERLDDRLKGHADVEQLLEVPLLASIPWFGGRRSRRTTATKTRELVTVERPNGVASEAYRSLRTNLQFITMQQGVKSILVTSPTAGEGKTVTSANLAVALAQAGRRVIVVSADMRRPTIEQYFKIERGEGLSRWLAEPTRSLSSLIIDPHVPNLRILPAGAVAKNPAEVLTSINLTRLVETLEENSDFVIFDSPPVLAVADASIMAARVGAVLLVLNATKTPRSAAARAKQELERAGGRVVGSVLNAFDSAASPYYYGSAYYGAPYAEQPEAASGNGSPKERPGLRSKLPFGNR